MNDKASILAEVESDPNTLYLAAGEPIRLRYLRVRYEVGNYAEEGARIEVAFYGLSVVVS